MSEQHVLNCGICKGPLTAMFNRDSGVGWGECLAGGHHYVQNIFTPRGRGSNHGYCFIEIEDGFDPEAVPS